MNLFNCDRRDVPLVTVPVKSNTGNAKDVGE